MGIGIPGSGKTTILKDMAETNEYTYICPDEIRGELGKNQADQSVNKEVWTLAYKRLKDGLEVGNTVVFDATFANPGQRKDFIKFARDNNAEKIQGVYLNIDLETAKERNKNRERVVPEFVLERMDKSIRDFPPEICDGFDSVFTLDENQKLVEVEMQSEEKIYHKEFGKIS